MLKLSILILVTFLVILSGVFIYVSRDKLFSTGVTFQTEKVEQSQIQNNDNPADLSYILLTVDDNVNIRVTDKNDDEVGQIFMEEPIKDPTGESNNFSKTLKEFVLSKPQTGVYYVDFSSLQDFSADFYFYDKNGEVSVRKINGEGNIGFRVNFDKDNSQNSTISSQR